MWTRGVKKSENFVNIISGSSLKYAGRVIPRGLEVSENNGRKKLMNEERTTALQSANPGDGWECGELLPRLQGFPVENVSGTAAGRKF